jgi:chorismate--pyruvate lyase
VKHWRSLARGNLPPGLRAWLAHAGSLTARLVACCDSFELRLLRQGPGRCLPDQRAIPGLAARCMIEREVLLCCDGLPVVYAQTVTPRDSAFAWPFLAGLGRKSLGSILFADAGIERGELRHALLPAAHPLAQRARRHAAWPGREGGGIHARRRLFRRGPGLLLVTELFLPAVLTLDSGKQAETARHPAWLDEPNSINRQ